MARHNKTSKNQVAKLQSQLYSVCVSSCFVATTRAPKNNRLPSTSTQSHISVVAIVWLGAAVRYPLPVELFRLKIASSELEIRRQQDAAQQ
jgi:hypothetical protein